MQGKSVVKIIHENLPEHVYDIVGPVCESSDWLGKQRALRVKNDDLLVMTMAGQRSTCPEI